MEQPLDLSITNTKTPFTIEYLTSENSNQKRKSCFSHHHHHSPLIPLENKHFSLHEYAEPRTNPLEIVNGGHGIKNPLFDCATEALQIKYGMKNLHFVLFYFLIEKL
jgi:hypothetical protein